MCKECEGPKIKTEVVVAGLSGVALMVFAIEWLLYLLPEPFNHIAVTAFGGFTLFFMAYAWDRKVE